VFSDYIVYVDESGDHNLAKVNKNYPIFCLSFCIVNKTNYAGLIVPEFQKFKFKYFGHDLIVLHENEIRKQKDDFAVLRSDPKLRADFYDDLNDLLKNSDMTLIASIVDKTKLTKKYKFPENPYNLSLLFCMEMLLKLLRQNGQSGKTIHVMFESRGKQEDADLELAFERITSNRGNWGYKSPDFSICNFVPIFRPKSVNSTGLQLADLTARPIGLNYLRPKQKNRAYEIISGRVQCKTFP